MVAVIALPTTTPSIRIDQNDESEWGAIFSIPTLILVRVAVEKKSKGGKR